MQSRMYTLDCTIYL